MRLARCPHAKRPGPVLRAAAALVLAAALAAGPAAAQGRDRGVFDIYLGSFKVGLFAFSGVEARGRYSAAGQLRSTGLIGALADVRYDAKAQGRVQQARHVPEVYEERANIGSRSSDLVISYKNGVPEETRFDPPRQSERPALDPRTQGGAVDLMTLFYTLLRDVPEDEVCRYDSFVFDGVRRTRVVLRPETRADTRISCAAEYRRVAGFSTAEMLDRPVFPFRLEYEATGEGTWRAVGALVETVYGTVRLDRRPPA